MTRRDAGSFGMSAHDPGDKKHAQSSFSDSAWQADSKELDFPLFKFLQSIDKRLQYLSPRRIELLFRLTIPFDIEQKIFEIVRSEEFTKLLFNFKKFSGSGIVPTDIFGDTAVDFAVESKQPVRSELSVGLERDFAGVKHILSPCRVMILSPLNPGNKLFDFHKSAKAPNTPFRVVWRSLALFCLCGKNVELACNLRETCENLRLISNSPISPILSLQ